MRKQYTERDTLTRLLYSMCGAMYKKIKQT